MQKEEDELIVNNDEKNENNKPTEVLLEDDISNFPEESEELKENEVIAEEENEVIAQEENVTDTNKEANELITNNENGKHRRYLVLKEKNKKRLKIAGIITLIILVNLFLIFGIIITVNRMNTNVYRNVHIFGQNISNMSSEQVGEFIKQEAENIDEVFNIDVYRNEKEIYNIKPEDIDFKVDLEKTATKVMNFGREDNFIVDNYKIIKALFVKKEIVPEYVYSEEKLDALIKNIDLTIDDRYSNDAFSIDEATNSLTITRGKTGNSIDYDMVKQDLLELLYKSKSTSYNIATITKKPTEINIDKLYSEVKRDPQDAYIDNDAKPPKFVKEVNGYDLNIDQLKELLNKEENKVEGASIEFKLTVVQPEVKLSDLTYNLYNDKLSGYTTYFDSSQKSRGNNLRIALEYLNGAIIMPGQVFSYYGRVGEINYAKGYKDAATFKGGTVVNEVGGGVCQTSSTLYNVALMANLQITERHQHGLPVGYVPPSRDATIYEKVLDLKFKNTRNYPVKIVTSYSEAGSMNISIYGTKEETEYDVSLTSKVLYYTPFTTRYIYDANLDEGTTIIINKGVNGFVSEGYITKRLNGSVVSSSLLSKDVYKPQQQVVKVGTKKVVKEPGSENEIY